MNHAKEGILVDLLSFSSAVQSTNTIANRNLIGGLVRPSNTSSGDTGDKDPYTQWARGEYIVGTDNN